MNIEWTVVNEGGKGTKAQIKLYDNEDWAAGFDVVVHYQEGVGSGTQASAHGGVTTAIEVRICKNPPRSLPLRQTLPIVVVPPGREEAS